MDATIAELTAWSLKCARLGVAPVVGFYGEAFPKNSFRLEMAGKQLAGGYKCLAYAKFAKF